jgi:hypothetical protein
MEDRQVSHEAPISLDRASPSMDLRLPEEPRFYKSLIGVAALLEIFTRLTFALIALTLTGLSIYEFFDDPGWWAIIMFLVMIIPLIFLYGLLVVLLNLVCLAVDAARNLRRANLFAEKAYYIAQQMYLDGLKNGPAEHTRQAFERA